MTFVSLVGVLKQKWRTLLAGAVVGLLIAGLVTWTAPRTYSATAGVYVAGIDNGPGADVVAGSLISPQRVASYRELMISDRVLDEVTRRLGAPVSRAEVAVTSRADSAVFTVAASTADPVRSAVVANAVADRFAEVVSDLERPGGPGTPATVSASPVNRAQPPAAPAGPGAGSTLLVGLVMGLVAALVTVLVRAVGDTSVRTTAQLRAAVGGAALGTLPSRGRRGTAEGHDVEAAREVRTRLRLATSDSPAPVLAFTAAVTAQGTTSAVCAIADAFSGAARVLVVDADLRQRSLTERLGVADGVGLVDVLSGRTSAEDAVRRLGRLDVLPAGSGADDPGELVAAPVLGDLLASWRSRYDLVLVDTPAVLSTADGVVVARLADGVVVLCREGATTRPQLCTAVDALRDAGVRLVGSVLATAGGGGPIVSSSGHDSLSGRQSGWSRVPESDLEAVTATPTPTSGS